MADIEYTENGWREVGMHSMLHRCTDWDYKQTCIYLLTLVVSGRQPLLGTLEGDHEWAWVRASEVGKAVVQVITNIPKRWQQLSVIRYQLMPDHLHLILQVKEPLPKHLGRYVGAFKTACSQQYSLLLQQQEQNQATANPQRLATENRTEVPPQRLATENRTEVPPQRLATENRTERQPAAVGSVPAAVGSVPAAVAAGDSLEQKPPVVALFEQGYHDRILFRAGQLENMVRYVEDNPRRLWLRRQHRDLFSIRREVQIGTQTYAAIGNLFLLDYPEKVQVQCSRRMTEHDIEKEKQQMLAAAQRGVVLVSPCISPGEKAIATAALDAKLPLIVLLENGFAPLFKPAGKYFDACAEGKLLLLAPWEYHADKRTITREQCLMLNSMAEEIANSTEDPQRHAAENRTTL